MAGHSKWANIKHRKERADKQKGKNFSRIAKEIIVAVKEGGADPKSNTKLRLAIQKAKECNFPNDNIERNIKKASSADSSDYVEMAYELYGHGGVGIIVELMTDNKNRISSDIHIATNKCGGNVTTPGAVSYNFDKKGIIQVLKEKAEEEFLFNLALNSGAEDFEVEDDFYIITTAPEELYNVKEKIEKENIKCENSSLDMIPKVLVECSDDIIEKNNKLIDWIENIDDVDEVYHNMDI
jgi:YebC/PmpR family DNA-binding regulatory protein